jgi:hypothetical protein
MFQAKVTFHIKQRCVHDCERNSQRKTFIKSDGTPREMHCTLMSEYLPQQIVEENVRHVPRRENDKVLAVWDIDSKGWRSFNLDSITNIEYIGVNIV